MNSNDFSEITDEFYAPTDSFRLGELIYSPGFTLLDAMSAIHIGDPRMDSFLSSSTEIAESFDPCQQLSLEDICYIIDRTTALELCFYSGSHLIQSSYTSLYLHKLSSFSLELLKLQSVSVNDKQPYEWEWIGLVLRSALIASLKCTNYAWSELIKGVMYDIEDFNSDKAGLSLGEMYDEAYVESLLKESLSWLDKKIQSGSISDVVIGLRNRIQLRHELYWIYNPEVTNSAMELCTGQYDKSLASINHALDMISKVSPCPAPSQFAHRAFYAGISKYLPNMAPLPPLDDSLLRIEGTNVWEGFRPSLESIRDINKAVRVQDPLEWINWISYRSISKPSDRALPAYVRNLTISRFISDDNLIYQQHSIEWITDALLEGMIGLPRGMVELTSRLNQAAMTVVGRNPMSIGQAFSVWSQRVAGFYVNLVATYCHNRSRQKRNLPKSIKQFEDLYSETSTFIDPSIESLQQLSPVLASLISLIPLAIRSFILNLHIESLLVTTELDLLDREHDWSIIYWQLSRVAKIWQQELDPARSRLSSLPLDARVGFTEALKANSLEWMKERTLFAKLIETLSQATLKASVHILFAIHVVKLDTPTVSAGDRHARFQRRLKWAMRGDMIRQSETDPSFEEYENDLFELNKAAPEAATRCYESALEKIDDLLKINTQDAHFKLSQEKRDTTLHALKSICQTNLNKMTHTPTTQQQTLKWSNSIQPWYPNLA